MADWHAERADLHKLFPTIDGLLCPVCIRSEKATMLTEGHVFPAECRVAKSIVPECDTCNHDLGSGTDAALGSLATAVLFTEGIHTEDQARRLYGRRLIVGGTSATVLSAKMNAGRFKLQLGYWGDDPKYIALPNGSISMPMKTEFGHSNMISGGLLHSALLRTFHYFGCSYALSPGVKPVQAALIQASLYAPTSIQAGATLGLFWNATRLAVDLPTGSERLFIARDSSGLPLAFANFVRYTPVKGGLAFVPGPRPEDYLSYKRLLSNEFDHIQLHPVVSAFDRETRLMSGAGGSAMLSNWNFRPEIAKPAVGFRLPPAESSFHAHGIASRSTLQTDITMEKLPAKRR